MSCFLPLPDVALKNVLENCPISYQSQTGGCLVKRERTDELFEKHLENEDFIKRLCRDFSLILKNRKLCLRFLRVIIKDVPASETFMPEFSNCLKSRIDPIKTKWFSAAIINEDQLLSILPYICSTEIEEIRINSTKKYEKPKLEMEKIVKLEQWKQSNSLNLKNFFVKVPLPDLTHFSRVNISFDNVSSEFLISLKEKMLISKTMAYFELHFQYISDGETLNGLFGEPLRTKDQYGQDRKQWLFGRLTITHIFGVLYFEC